MKRSLMSLVPLAFAVGLAQPVLAQDLASQLVGVWKMKTFENLEVESKKVLKPFGENPAAYYVFTKGGRFISVTFGSDRKPPAGGGPTDAERIDLFKTMSATSGAYKVQDGKVAITYDGSWIQGWTGKTQVREVTISGTTMTYRSPPQPAGSTGIMIIFTAVLEKVE